MKKLIVISILLAHVLNCFGVEFPLNPPLTVGTIESVTTDNALFNLNDDSWIVTVKPVITNKLSSNTNSVVFKNNTISISSIAINVRKQDVYTTLGVTNFENTLLIDFQNALITTAMQKLYLATTSTNQP